jgi:predicted TIM-barrel fold metal-dependent hydrolase
MAQDNIRGRLLLVEQHFIDEFNERYPRLIDKNKIEARASLEMLKRVCAESGGRWRLAVIKTDVNAYQLKLPVVQQIENLKNEKSILVQTVKRLRRGIRRLEQAGLPHPCPNDVAEEEQKLAALLQRQNYLEKLSAKDSDYEEFMARGCK